MPRQGYVISIADFWGSVISTMADLRSVEPIGPEEGRTEKSHGMSFCYI